MQENVDVDDEEVNRYYLKRAALSFQEAENIAKEQLKTKPVLHCLDCESEILISPSF